MTVPNFFLVGAPKCGTSAWVSYLRTHPDIGFSRQKEPHFFSTDFPNYTWARNKAEYLAQFDACAGAKAVGEASVHYLYSQAAPENLARFAPEARILLFLREPGDFLKSYHNQMLRSCDEDIADLATAWACSGQRRGALLPPHCREPAFLDYASVVRFGAHLHRWLGVFAPERVLVLSFEDWVKDPRPTYLRILKFLDLPDDGREVFTPVNVRVRARSQMLARFVRRPPALALRAAGLLRRGLGLERLGLAGRLRALNERPGYARPTDAAEAALLDEIRAGLAEDQRLLRRLCERCA